MASLSDYGYESRSSRQSLLSKLVCKILIVQPGEDHHDLALEFCLHHADFHRFGDTNPNTVEEQYDRLQGRMRVNAQFHKEKALATLRSLFLGQRLSDDALDVHHRVLSALYCLARQPLQCDYRLPLSLAHSIGTQETAGVPDKAAARLSGAWDFGKHGQIRLAPTPPDQATYPEGCLLSRLRAAEDAHTSTATTPVKLCFAEHELVLQVLQMLRGSPSPGPAINLNPDNDAFEPLPGVHAPHLTPGCVSSLLSRFAATATTAYRLRVFVSALRSAAITPPDARSPLEQSSLVPGPTIAAFATALAGEQDVIEASLIRLQEHFEDCIAKGERECVSMVALEAAVQAPVRCLDLLEAVAASLQLGGAANRTAAGQATSVINGLHTALVQSATNATPQGKAQSAVLLRLLACSMRPFLEMLHSWLAHGRLEDAAQEFFICRDASVPRGTPSLWHDAYRLRPNQAASALLCPELVWPLADDILAAGNSAQLLRTHSEQHGHGSASEHSVARGSGLDLYKDIVHRLQALKAPKEDVVAPKGGCNSIAGRMAASLSSSFPNSVDSIFCSASCSHFQPTAPQPLTNELGKSPFCEALSGRDLLWAPLQHPGSCDWGLSQHLISSGTLGSGASPANTIRQAALSANPAATAAAACISGGFASASDWASSRDPSTHRENCGLELLHASAYSAALPPGLQQCADARGVLADVSNSVGDGSQKHCPAQQKQVQAAEAHSVSSRLASLSEAVSHAAASIEDQFGSGEWLSGTDEQLKSWYSRMLGLMTDPRHASGSHNAPCFAACMLEEAASAQQQATSTVHATLIRPFSGKAAQQMWGDSWRQLPHQECTAWLSELDSVDLSPVGVTLQECILAPIQAQLLRDFWHNTLGPYKVEAQLHCEREYRGLEPTAGDFAVVERCKLDFDHSSTIWHLAEDKNRQLLDRLMGSWGLKKQLAALQDVYFMAAPAMQSFSNGLIRTLGEMRQGDKEGSGGVWRGSRVFELQGLLEEGLSAIAFPLQGLKVEVGNGSDEGGNAAQPSGTAVMRQLRISFQLCHPLSLVLQESHIQRYNAILTFLLQVSWARAALLEAQITSQEQADLSRGTSSSDRAVIGLAWEMSHFVKHLHGFTMDRLMHAAVPNFMRALGNARSLDEVTAAHDAYLGAAEAAAMVCRKVPEWTLAAAAVRKLLDLALQFVTAVKGGRAAGDDLASLQQRWTDRHRYLIRLLSALTLKGRDFTALEGLLALLDFNGFYSGVHGLPGMG